MITSVMSTPSGPAHRSGAPGSRIRNCSGPTPDRRIQCPAQKRGLAPAEIRRVRSTAWTSLGSSTTQTCEPSPAGVRRRVRQRSSSETLPHTAQKPHAVADFGQHRGEPIDVRRFDGQQMKRRCAARFFGPIPGSLPSSSIRFLDRSLKHPTRRPYHRPADPAAPAPIAVDLLGGVGERGRRSKSCSVSTSPGSTTFGIDLHRDYLAAALDGDLHQTATGLSVHLGVDEPLLGSPLAVPASAAPGRAMPTCPAGLRVCMTVPLAYWSRLGFACALRAVSKFQA